MSHTSLFKNTAVIIPTHNAIQHIKPCINSVLQHNPGIEIFIIDNHSKDGTIDQLKTFGSNINCIENRRNIGFGKAINQGILRGLGKGMDYFFILNQDTILFEDTLAKLHTIYKKYLWHGILSPMHYTLDKEQLDKLFKKYLNDATVQTLDITEVPFVNAAAWFFDRKTILKAGLFDPLFFHTGEDQDYCNRLRYHRLKIGIVNAAGLIHNRNDRATYGMNNTKDYRHSIFADFVKKAKDINSPFLTCFLKSLQHLMKELVRQLGKPNFLYAIVAIGSYFHFLTKIPQVLNHRAICKKEGAFLNPIKHEKAN